MDIALYDTYAMGLLQVKLLERIVRNPQVKRVAIYSWTITPGVVSMARAAGVSGVLSKRLPAAELVKALERIAAGEQVISPLDDPPDEITDDADASCYDAGDPRYDGPLYDAAPLSATLTNWPGRPEGLTARQSEVIALICLGMSNEEIAEATYLSVNTVKSYIRDAYRTMDVTSRTQAILWAIDHGFNEDRGRLLPQQL